MSWHNILKLRPIEDIPDEMYDDSYSYQNPKEIESLLRRKQKKGGLLWYIEKDHAQNANVADWTTDEGVKFWDMVVSDLKNIYNTNNLTHKNYKNGTILAGSEGVDKSVFSMIMSLDPNFGAPMSGEQFMRENGFKGF
tara:strand:- start:1182 stop:1595 length:414 start_codon:yes stop_codon:yes gene_type:complete